MNIRIKAVRHPGELERERLVLTVSEKDDIGHYVVFDTSYYDDGSVSNRMRHPYWFPDRQVNPGDVVILYTKLGENFSRYNDDGTLSHFFYMDLAKTIWNKDGDCAVILDIRRWNFKRVE